MTVTSPKPFTGRHMAAILVAGFGVVIGVNVSMATLASTTFGGIVVENSYVASQQFNRWLSEAARARGLGWRLDAGRTDGHVAVSLDLGSTHAASARIGAVARHPLGRLADVPLSFRRTRTGWVSVEPLPAGRWIVRFDVEAGEARWRTEQEIGA
ncbi:FixH family protein [Novosphingobium panipatense]|uniref:Nitrogen fixation protein FixH n=1 Tax=Novosphingobium panipatense TaxID=428991 RepID=A0ABY1QW48_9SPHN|nr:FixH family protein [Novosphingobium panipatense]SMP82083.1 Nitrogen fixation protein FixH [Novosphingobium panipatense]